MRRLDLLPGRVLEHLAALVAAVDTAETADIPWRKQTRFHFLRNFTIEPLEPYLKFHLLREDIQPIITFGGYDSMEQEILDPDSLLNRSCPDVIVLSLLIESFDRTSSVDEWTADQALARLNDLVSGLIDRTDAMVVANIMLPTVDALLSGDLNVYKNSQLDRLNDRLREIATQNPFRITLSDWNHHVSEMAAGDALDSRFWKLSRAPFKRDFLNRYAKDIAEHADGLKGFAKKCLILDCDNTLWGGVVGEDGVDGICLHPDDPPGRFFHKFQQSILALHERGIMLALCSKNNEQDVWDVIESHPNCLLKKVHLVAWRINWENKAKNIVSIADELNIGIDSMVFVDDSPQECALIRELLPDVTTIQLPESLSANADFLTSGGLFDAPTTSNEDRMRTQMYQEEAQRRHELKKSGDLTTYLRSLSTEVRVARAADDELARVAQLTQKTNQFNLTTRRYSEAEIHQFAASEDAAVFSMSVVDRYGDMGLTGVLIARHEGSRGSVDTLLLSCRILGRQLEFAFVDQCMRRLEEIWRLDSWEAEYIPTKKNIQVSDFWDRIGFDLEESRSEKKCYSTNKFSRPNEYLNIMNVHME